MNYHKTLNPQRSFGFAPKLNDVRLLVVFAQMIWFASQTSFASTNQIDVANKLVTKMMVEVESILATDVNDDMARRENVSALFDR